MCTNIDETSNSKRKALELITNIFRKKSKECLKNWNETENYPPAPTMNTPSESTDNAASIVDSQKDASSPSFYLSEFGIPPHSPVSPRVKNIDEDMEALTLSRQDNPFLASKLEKLSASEELLSSSSSLTIQHDDNIATPATSSNDCYYQQHLSPTNKTGSSSFINPSLHNLEIEEITQDDSNLHQHLIRSPPPQFPTKLSHFVFPLPNSPIRNISSRYGAFLSPDHRSESKSDHRSGSINLSTKPLADKLAFQSTHSLSIKSPPKIFNYRKNSMGHIGDKLINQSSSSSSPSSSLTSENITRRSSSDSFKKNLTKIPKTSDQFSNETAENTDHHLLNNPKSSSNLSSSKEHCNNVIDYLKGKITGNGSKEDEDKLKDNEDHSNIENDPSCKWTHSESGLSNSREALISTQSSLTDASN